MIEARSINWTSLTAQPHPVGALRLAAPIIGRSAMEMVRIFDTTLRDGEQAPGFSMNTAEKLRLARRLESLGVDVIEAGFPIASKGDFEAVREVAREIKHSTVAGLARAKREDNDATLGALGRAALPRVHVFLATADLHLKHKLRISRTEPLDSSARIVAY